MTDQSLAIVDKALWISLWTFLALFLLSLLFIRYRLSKGRSPVEESEAPQPILKVGPDEIRSTVRALVVCSLVTVAVFLALTLTPLPLIDNFVNSESWHLRPLRLTHLTMQRLHQGFVLEGEVYNQTEMPMEGVSALVKIWGIDQRLLAELPADLKPMPVEAGRPARFKLRYDDEPANLYGYEIVFVDAEGIPIFHTQGFDVRREDRVGAPEDESKDDDPIEQ